LPVEALKNSSWPSTALIIGYAAFLFIVSIMVFNRAVKKYESSNFMTFGN
jgi:hypothetical protein